MLSTDLVQPEDVKTWLGYCRHKSHSFPVRCGNVAHQKADTFHVDTHELIAIIADVLNGQYDKKTMDDDFGYWMQRRKVSKFENTKFWKGG